MFLATRSLDVYRIPFFVYIGSGDVYKIAFLYTSREEMFAKKLKKALYVEKDPSPREDSKVSAVLDEIKRAAYKEILKKIMEESMSTIPT